MEQKRHQYAGQAPPRAVFAVAAVAAAAIVHGAVVAAFGQAEQAAQVRVAAASAAAVKAAAADCRAPGPTPAQDARQRRDAQRACAHAVVRLVQDAPVVAFAASR